MRGTCAKRRPQQLSIVQHVYLWGIHPITGGMGQEELAWRLGLIEKFPEFFYSIKAINLTADSRT